MSPNFFRVNILPTILFLSGLIHIGASQFNCPSACFQGTVQNAGPAVSDSFCPLAADIVNPVYTPNCLCYTPETFDGTPWLFCYTCGPVLSGDFADVCGTRTVTQSCPNQQDGINDACKASSNINDVLGKLCDNGKPSAIVAGIGAAITFFMPELAEGALSLVEEGCVETKTASTISSTVGKVCDVWQTAGCGTVAAVNGNTGTTSSSNFAESATQGMSVQLAFGIMVLVIIFS